MRTARSLRLLRPLLAAPLLAILATAPVTAAGEEPAAPPAETPAPAPAAAAPAAPPAETPAAAPAAVTAAPPPATPSAAPASDAPAIAPAAAAPASDAPAIVPSAAPPKAAPIAASAAQPAPAPRTPETHWYRPTRPDEADTARPWNSSILGGFDPWTKQKVTILAQKQTFRIEGSRSRGVNDLKDAAGNEARVWYEPLEITHDQLAPRLEWGNWAVSFAQGRATFAEKAARTRYTAAFQEVTVSRGFGAWAIYDFGIPDIRVGLSWPEIYLRAGWSEELKDVSPTIEKMRVWTGALGISWIGLRLTIGDLLFAEARIGHWGVHAIGRELTHRSTDPSVGSQTDAAVQDGVTRDWLPTFRLGIAL